MADYQEYRRRVLGRRRRRALGIAALVALVLFLAVGGALLWGRMARRSEAQPPAADEPAEPAVPADAEWNHLDYAAQAGGTVQRRADGTTAMDSRLAALPENGVVELSYFGSVTFVGDSITQGLELYETGLPNAHYCAYKGVGPSAIVNGTVCKRADGTEEVPMDALLASAPRAVYLLLGTNVLTRDTDYSGFLAYYGSMIDMLRAALPNAEVYVQSVTPVRPEVSQEENHTGMYRERFCQVNNELAALALEKGCHFLDLWEVLADENGDLRAEYAQPDGYHLRPEGYEAWVQYLRTHTAYTPWAEYQPGTSYKIEG